MASPTGLPIDTLLAVERVSRRILRRRVPADGVDDQVQRTLELVLVNAQRLSPETAVAFAAVVARNLAVDEARSSRRQQRTAHLHSDGRDGPEPFQTSELAEVRAALVAAFQTFSPEERLALIPGEDRAGPDQPASAAERSRLRRLRAKARVEYLLAYRRIRLSTHECRSVLMSLSLGDHRAQRRSHAAEHLLECPTCAELAEPLVRRRSDLALLGLPLAAARWAWGKVRSQPVISAVGSAAAVAAALMVILTPWAPGRSPRGGATASPPTTMSAPASPAVPWLVANDGRAVPATAALQALSAVGVSGNAPVEEVVSRNGFWVGSSASDRVWVELVGPLRDIRLDAGDIIAVSGRVVANSPDYPHACGIRNPLEVAQLAVQGDHLVVQTDALSLVRG